LKDILILKTEREMALLFTDFKSWRAHTLTTGEALYQPVLGYEVEQKGKTEEHIWEGMQRAYEVMNQQWRQKGVP
jgi:L-serine dehydratase